MDLRRWFFAKVVIGILVILLLRKKAGEIFSLASLVFNWRRTLLGGSTPRTHATTQLNDSVYELHKPTTRKPNMDVLFFHGLQLGDSRDAFETTWTSGDGSHLWPQTWLADAFPSARILSISYDACVRKNSEHGRFDMYNIGESLTADLIELAKVGQECPVVLVGHSFGGLVIKQLCLQAYEMSNLRRESEKSSIQRFLANVEGMMYYGTPHRGIPSVERMAVPSMSGPLLAYVRLLSEEGARLNHEFDLLWRLKKFSHWRIVGVGEALPTKWGPFNGVIVPEASARYGDKFCIMPKNHVSLCKPEAKTSSSYLFLKEVLEDVLGLDREQPRRDNFQAMPDQFEGRERLVHVKAMLKKSKCVGMVGMGGIGKTTMARAIFNEIASEYEYSCFVLDVKSYNGEVEQEVLRHMHWDGRQISEARRKEGLGFLRGKQLLLVLDDVALERDLGVLRKLKQVFNLHEASRFILTSRDRGLLGHADLDDIYDVKELGFDSSRRLFVACAFRGREVTSSFEMHINEIVRSCGGLPLALEVVGNYLHKKPEKIWEQAIKALVHVDSVVGFDEKLWKRLKLSYDGLDKVEQEMFIQAATFFEGRPLYMAKAAWSVTTNGTEHLRWQHLLDMSLVQEVQVKSLLFGSDFEDDKTCIRVHEQLRSLGWSIARNCGENNKWGKVLIRAEGRMGDVGVTAWKRFWEEPYQELEMLYCCGSENLSVIPAGALSKMGRLQFLCLKGDRNGCNWLDGIAGLPPNLVFLYLSECRKASLQQLDLTSLTRLNFLKLKQLHGVLTLPDGFGPLSGLRALKLHFIMSLDCLPDTFGDLVELTHLSISYCQLSSLPESFGRLEKLEYLSIKVCPRLRSLPSSFGRLRKLEHLVLSDCRHLVSLPVTFGELVNLTRLEIGSCGLWRLPKSFGGLKKLEYLAIVNCDDLRSLHEKCGELATLKKLRLEGCRNLQGLLDSTGNIREVPAQFSSEDGSKDGSQSASNSEDETSSSTLT